MATQAELAEALEHLGQTQDRRDGWQKMIDDVLDQMIALGNG